MALTPSLARLSLVARTGAKKARGGDEAKEELPAELWTLIVALSADDDDDICKKIKELCDMKSLAKWLGSCKDDSFFFEEINKHLGWYGDLPDWAAVKAHYQEGRAWAERQDSLNVPTEAETPNAYFRDVCIRRKRIRDLSRSYRTPRASYMNIVFGSRMSERVGDRMRYWYPPYTVSLAKYTAGLNWAFLELVPGSVKDDVASVAFYGTPEWGTIDGYAEIAKAAMSRASGLALKFVPGSINARTGEQKRKCIDEYAEIAKIALEHDGLALRYVPGSLVDLADPEVPLSKPIEQYAELAKVAVRTNGFALKYVPGSIGARTGVQTRDFVEKYAEIATVAVRAHATALNWVPPNHPKYAEIAQMAVEADPHALEYVPKELPNYAQIAEMAIRRSPDVIMYVPVDHVDYDALEALAERKGANSIYMT